MGQSALGSRYSACISTCRAAPRNASCSGVRREYPRLTPEQLAFLGAALHVDMQALYLLPRALCPICSTVYLGGMFSAEAYSHHRGYRFLWESASPRRIRLLAMVC